jgi:hypothetical protein
MSINIMDKLDNLIKDKKKFISAKTLNKINEDFISIIFDSRKNEAKRKIESKIKKLEKIQIDLQKIDSKGKSYKESMADKKLFENVLSGNVAQQSTSQISSENRMKRRLDNHIKLNFNDNIKNRVKGDRKALGGVFKESFINDLDQNLQAIISRVSKKIEYEFIFGEKKFDIRCYIVILIL